MATRTGTHVLAVGTSSSRVQLWLIATVLILAMGTWFSASAVVPALERAWHITQMQSVWLTSSVQLGFVLGAVGSAALNLPDRIPPQIVAGAASMGAALAFGSALPHLIRGFGQLPWQGVLLFAALFAGIGGCISMIAVRPGPYGEQGPVRLRPGYAIEMFKEAGPRLANLGYFGHMWELYALWTWLPMFLLAIRPADEATVGLVTFVTIGVAGALGCLLGGWASNGLGRGRAAGYAMLVSGLCCLVSPVLVGSAWPVVIVLLMVWGASVIADSPVFRPR